MLTLFPPSNTLCEYFIIISPPHLIKKEVKSIKYEFAKKNGVYTGLHSHAHITLMNFPQSEERERELAQSIRKIVSEQPCFCVLLKGFDFFPANNTFFINIKNKKPIEKLYETLRVSLYQNRLSLKNIKKGCTPHLTIGRKLSDDQYINAYKSFSEKPYTAGFNVDSLTLLKRGNSVDRWSHFIEAPFIKKVDCTLL